jgi:predicted nucleic acid-binding protein
MIIADSSPLIIVTKISKLSLLRKLYGSVLIPGAVFNEVVIEGKRLQKAGVEEIESALQAGWLKTVSLTRGQLTRAEQYRLVGRVDKGEAEAISLAVSRKLLIVVDDKNARQLANTLELKFQGTAAVLMEAYISRLLSKKEFIENLRELGKVMWLAPEIMAELFRLAEEVNNDDKERTDGRDQIT